MSVHDLNNFKDHINDTGDFLFLVNGRTIHMRADGPPVRIEVDSSKKISFFYNSAVRTEATSGKVTLKSQTVQNAVESFMDSTNLFGFEFKGWMDPSLLQPTLSQRLVVKSAIKVISYETLEYYSLKIASINRSKQYTLKNHSTGEVMDDRTLSILINKLRQRGFESYLSLYNNGLHRPFVFPRNLQRVTSIYSLAFYYVRGLYHPLMDDPELHESFRNTELGKVIFDKIQQGDKDTTFSYVTAYELSKVLNVGGEVRPTLLHLKYPMLMALLSAHFLYDLDPIYYPLRDEFVWRRKDTSDLDTSYPTVVNKSNYNEIEEVAAEHYDRWESYNFYWFVNRSYLMTHGLGSNVISNADYFSVVDEIRVV